MPIRRQRPVKGGRDSLPSCVIGKIKEAVEFDARFYGVSKSFVISVILANAYGINEQENFIDDAKSVKSIKKK